MHPSGSDDINLKNLSDEGLTKLLESTESELRNESRMKSYPLRAQILNDRHQNVIKEMHKRKIIAYLPEPDTVHDIKAAKKDFMRRWLSRINYMDMDRLDDPKQ